MLSPKVLSGALLCQQAHGSLTKEPDEVFAEVQSSADSLTEVNEGSRLSDGDAMDTSQGVSLFLCASMDAGGLPPLQPLPQVATAQDSLGKGSDSDALSLSEQAQASALDGERPYFLDVFCGTAGVTAALKRYGAEAIGVDHVIDKRRMKGPAVKLDLSKKSAQKLEFDEIKGGRVRVKGVMLAPPCGTFTKAGNIP